MVRYKEGGYAIVSRDDLLNPVSYYVDHGDFDTTCPGIHVIISWIGRSLDKIQQLPPTQLAQVIADHGNQRSGILSFNNKVSSPLTVTAIGPLVTSEWYQDEPFNNLAPGMVGCYGWHCAAGCVAISMSQIMNYWEWPTIGQGSESYTTGEHNWNLSADFGATTYDWPNMVDTLDVDRDGDIELSEIAALTTAQTTAMQTLAFHCGVAVHMDYCEESNCLSGAWDCHALNRDATDAYNENFRYWGGGDPDCRWSVTLADIVDEIKYLRPIEISGDSPVGGHSWVVAGYRQVGSTTELWHNLGWGGDHNGWYAYPSMPKTPNVPEYEFEADDLVRRIAPNYVYFCGGMSGSSGSPSDAYVNLDQAITNIPTGKTLIMFANTNWPGTFTITKAMVIRSASVIIGQ